MQIETLKVYCDLVETESFSQAAERNFITQSAVSQQVRGLEEKFKRRLLERVLKSIPWSGQEWHLRKSLSFATKPTKVYVSNTKRVDFLRGPSEMVEAIEQGRPHRLSAEMGVHIVELIEALQYPERFRWKRTIESTFDPIEPLTP